MDRQDNYPAIVRTAVALMLLLGTSVLLASCGHKGGFAPGSTYCDPMQGGSQIPMSKLPSGACKGTATCIALTAYNPCPPQPPGECQWTCTCVSNAWDCTAGCGGAMCTDGAIDSSVGDADEAD